MSGCSCGANCKCGSGCSCEMYLDMEKSSTITIIEGVAPAKMFAEGSEESVEGGNGCKCGSSCSCNPCKC